MSETPERTNQAEKLFPLGKQYTLHNGKTIEVRPWSIKTMVRVSQRVPRVLEKIRALKGEVQDQSVQSLVPILADEFREVVAETLGWEPARVDEEMDADDFLSVVQLVWDECLVGLLAKSLGLTMRLGSLLGQPAKVDADPAKTTQ